MPASKTLDVNERIRIPLSELDFIVARSSGPGGQNVNKVNSKVQLRWNVVTTTALPPEVLARFRTLHRNRINSEGVFLLVSQSSRDQSVNKETCLERLREFVAAASIVPKRRKATRVPRSAKRRRLKDKKHQSERKNARRKPRADE